MFRTIIASALLLFGATAAGAATITVAPVPLGGYATSNVGGLDCGGGVGAAIHTTCTTSGITLGASVILTAHPYPGCTFLGWNVPGIGISATNPLAFTMPGSSVSGSANFQCPPAFTSANATTFQTSTPGSFSVTVSGDPSLNSLSEVGILPSGVTMAYAIDGGTLSGTPGAGTGGVYPLTFTAANGILPNAIQSFTLTVNQPPAITSAASAAFTVGAPGSFAVMASSYPASTFSVSAGGLPTGVTLATNGTLSGTPAAGTAGVYPVTITATNAIAPDATQSFTLTVGQASGLIPPPTRNFEGMGQGFSGPAGAFSSPYMPSTTNIAVGPNHIVQVVNASFAVFDKTGTKLKGPVDLKTLWSGSPSACFTTNDGTPMVQYDRAADRWVVTHLIQTPPQFFLCVAVSKTADPTGLYNLYPFNYPTLIDRPRLAVWPDGYYVTFDKFDSTSTIYVGAMACALNRASMLQGLASAQQCLTNAAGERLLPSDLDGPVPPPAGSPNYLVSLGASNALDVWKFHVDWTTPANTTLTGPVTLSTAAYTIPCGGSAACVEQGGTTSKLDALGNSLMYRLAYRNFGDHESLVASHAVVAGTSAGMRWYELRSPGSSPVIFQQGTQAPDTDYRWAGSAAMDWQGNLALGYSVSGTTMKPQIRYAARLAGDAAGQLAQGEATVAAGGGAQTGSLTRWGDVTAMRIDPSDDCTFWYTNQYIPADGSFNWRTRIASFKIPSCFPPTTTALASSVNPSVFGQSVTLTATVTGTGSTPTGTVTFNDGVTILCGAVALAVGQAQCATGVLTTGTHGITATYSGNASNGASTSPALNQVVNKAGTTTAIGAHAPNPSIVGLPITVNATVTVTAPGTGIPSGTITVSDGTASCVITLPASGCTLTPSSAGTKTLTATYSGDANYSASISPGVGHVVDKLVQSITFGAAPLVVVGGTGTMSATATSGLAVTFSTASLTCSVNASTGVVTGVSVGICAIAADQAGNGNYLAALQATQNVNILSGSLTMTVGRAAASTGTGTVTSSPAGINCGATCVASFAALSTVSLTPAPATGSVFTGWGGACTGTGACNVMMDGPKTVTARFDLSASVADVGVSQSASPNPAGTDKDVTYALTVSNAGPGPASAVTLADTLPIGSTFVWASPGCANAFGTVTCSLGTLANGASTQVKIIMRHPAAGSITNTATVSATQGDPNSANNSSSSTITVNTTPVAMQALRYRLYSPVTLEHHFTTDLNEYNVLGGYVGTWVQEGTVGKVLNNPGSFNGVTAVPYYRLYNTSTQWHHWTTDSNEYYTLIQFPWWTGEGVDGYILPTTTAGATQLYRLLYPFIPGLHHWTIDPTEYGILISTYGWIGEGGSGFVIQ